MSCALKQTVEQDIRSESPDRELVKRLKESDIAAFEMLYDKYSAKVYNFVRTTLYNPLLAEDITQNVFLKLWEKRMFLDEQKSLASYIYTIAKHFVWKQTEKLVLHNRYMNTTAMNSTELDESGTQELDALFLTDYIKSIVVKLPPSRREIFILSRIEGLSNKEIATRMGISEKTVETQIRRATHFIRQYGLK